MASERMTGENLIRDEENKKAPFLHTYMETEAAKQRESVLHAAIKRIQNVNLATLTRSEIKSAGREIIREANRRMRDLEANNITSSPAYRYVKRHLKKTRFSLAGDDRAKILNNLRMATDFLHATTSMVEGAIEYDTWLDSHIGIGLTEDEKVELWEVIHAFEDTYPQRFYNFGYDVAIRQISTAYHMTRDKEATRKAFLDLLNNEGILADVEKGNLDEDTVRLLKQAGVEPWIKRDL